jgi:predicted flap endonuclease-1-like 5' DNA nuclease
MIYLITVLAPWLLLTAAFAGLAGWAVAAGRGAPAQVTQCRERDKLVRDLAQLAAGEATPQTAIVNEADAARSLAAIRDGRIAELERALEQSRARAAELAGELAEVQRRSERGDADGAELARLRALVDAHEAQAAQTIDAQAEPAHAAAAHDEASALQTWRLRYFEQRVQFLEGRTAAPALPAPAVAPASEEHTTQEWRAREAEARASFLEQELRNRSAPAAGDQASPFAANADDDVLLRWRMLYLERRVAHLQESAGQPMEAVAELAPQAGPQESAADPDRWKWRARYLESRVRHLEQRGVPALVPANGAAAAPPIAEPAPPPPAPSVPEERPPALPAATSGAPDDFTLIDGVSPLQQSTLNSLGIYHFDQIAGWTPANVAWVDRYLRLRGRIGEEEWIEQAAELVEHGVHATRPQSEGARA